jgi:hypothetical protein
MPAASSLSYASDLMSGISPTYNAKHLLLLPTFPRIDFSLLIAASRPCLGRMKCTNMNGCSWKGAGSESSRAPLDKRHVSMRSLSLLHYLDRILSAQYSRFGIFSPPLPLSNLEYHWDLWTKEPANDGRLDF